MIYKRPSLYNKQNATQRDGFTDIDISQINTGFLALLL